MTVTNDSPVLWGCKSIARAIGHTPAATFHLLASGKLPARKMGRSWVANREDLINYLRTGSVGGAQ